MINKHCCKPPKINSGLKFISFFSMRTIARTIVMWLTINTWESLLWRFKWRNFREEKLSQILIYFTKVCLFVNFFNFTKDSIRKSFSILKA